MELRWTGWQRGCLRATLNWQSLCPLRILGRWLSNPICKCCHWSAFPVEALPAASCWGLRELLAGVCMVLSTWAGCGYSPRFVPGEVSHLLFQWSHVVRSFFSRLTLPEGGRWDGDKVLEGVASHIGPGVLGTLLPLVVILLRLR